MKTCAKCDLEKPIDDFYRDKKVKSGYRARCRACVIEGKLAYYANNRERIREQRKEWASRNPEVIKNRWLRSLYGIDLDRYHEILERQGGCCAICRTRHSGSRAWHVDHDHACCTPGSQACGRCVRGLLCQSCNLMLGQAKDNPATLLAALRYLEVSNA